MKKDSDDSWLGLLLVVLLHAGALYAFTKLPASAEPKAEPPRIQGVLIPAPPAEKVQLPSARKTAPAQEKPIEPRPKPKPKPTPKTKPKPKTPPPVEAPPSERAVTKEPVVEEPPPETQPELAPAIVSEDDNKALGAPVTPPRQDANSLNNPAPAYPSISRRLREEGIVVLELLILPDGHVGEVRIKKSSGFARLDETAMKAVKRWKYIPAMKGNTPIAYWYLQPLEFALN